MIKTLILLFILFFITTLLLKKVSRIKPFKNVSNFFLGVSFLVITLLVLFSLRVFNDISYEGTYTPAEYEGGVLKPGKVEFEKE